jgi:hypothetical protein
MTPEVVFVRDASTTAMPDFRPDSGVGRSALEGRCRVARRHGETTIERDTQAPTAHTQPDRVDAKGLSRVHPRRRTVAAIRAWLGTSTWPAYWAAAITAAYGLLKAYWVFGGTALWSIAPLPQELIDKLRSGTAPTWFLIADAVSLVLAVVGVLFALATVRPRQWLPVWLVRWLLWPLATFMVLRGVLGMIGDVQQIASGESGPLTHQAIWDLALWAPLFLIWGLLWAATVITYTRRSGALPRSQSTGR